MKVIAKDSVGYPEYPYTNWIKGNEYWCEEEEDLLKVADEQGVTFYFTG
jgi:hypothetical protein